MVKKSRGNLGRYKLHSIKYNGLIGGLYHLRRHGALQQLFDNAVYRRIFI
jgi:hypothetical protein